MGPSGCCTLIMSTSRLDEVRRLGNHSREDVPKMPWGCVITAFKCLKGKDLEEGTCLLGVLQSGKKAEEGEGEKPQEGRGQPAVRSTFLHLVMLYNKVRHLMW